MNVLTFSRSMVAALLVIAQALSATPVMGQQQDEQNRQNRNEQQEDQAKLPGDQTPSQEHADDHSPALGVLVSSCPGEAVCVRDVIWGSPADEEGIQPGDYIVSVDGQNVTTPAAFRKMLEQKDAKQKVNLTVWRQSQQINKTVSLAAESEKLPDGHNAWLGVMLTPTDSEGLEILQVVPGSPADEAGLKSGERILQMNDKEVKNVESFVECVDDIGPGKQLKLAVGGNGSEREVQVKLGELQNAPMRVLREIYSEALEPSLEPFDSPPQNVSTESLELIDETLDQMRQQIRTLEEEVRELRSGKQTKDSKQHEKDAKQERDANDAESNDDEKEDRAADPSPNHQTFSTELSLLPMTLASAPVSTVLAQQDGRRSNWNQNRGRNWNNNSHWGNRYSLPNYSQHYGSQRYGSRYGNYYNTYPNYGNSYYRYGGQPYYYNRGYGNNRYGSGLGIYGLPRLGTRSGTGLFWY